jgi:drug/metabolite transporter (DMT)-like permease
MIAIFLGLGAALSWSLHDLLARVFTPRFGAYRMAMVVLLVGAVLLLPLVMWRGRLSLLTFDAGLTIFVMGLVYAAALAGLLKAFSLAPVSVVGPLTASYPALVVLWGLFNGLTPGALEWFAIAIILCGAVMVGKLGPPDGGLQAVPKDQVKTVLIASAVAALGFATVIVLGQNASAVVGPFETTFLSRFPAALALLPVMWRERPAEMKFTSQAALAGGAMALCDVIAVTTINMMGAFPNKAYGAMAISSYGAMAALLGLWLLKEKAAPGNGSGSALSLSE